MASNENLQLFEEQPIRTAWNEEEEEWYFSIVDVVGVLTDQPDVRRASTYWAVLKNRLNEEGANELLTNCKQLKLKATDGKRRLTDVANTEQLLRLIQSIPSKKAEPFKKERPEGFEQSVKVAQAGGSVAGNARRDLETRLGKPVVTSQNAAQLNHVVTQMIEASANASEEKADEQ